jgi:hypothetical protein
MVMVSVERAFSMDWMKVRNVALIFTGSVGRIDKRRGSFNRCFRGKVLMVQNQLMMLWGLVLI